MNTIICARCGYRSEMTRIVGRRFERTADGIDFIIGCEFVAQEREAGRPIPSDEACPHFKAALEAMVRERFR